MEHAANRQMATYPTLADQHQLDNSQLQAQYSTFCPRQQQPAYFMADHTHNLQALDQQGALNHHHQHQHQQQQVQQPQQHLHHLAHQQPALYNNQQFSHQLDSAKVNEYSAAGDQQPQVSPGYELYSVASTCTEQSQAAQPPDTPLFYQHEPEQPQPQPQIVQDPLLQPEAVSAQIKLLFQLTDETEVAVKSSSDDLEAFKLEVTERSKVLSMIEETQGIVVSHDPQRVNEALVHLESCNKRKVDVENNLRELALKLNESRLNIIPKQRKILDQISVVQQAVLNLHLARWQQDQQFSLADKDVLSQIQLWVEGLTEVTWRLRNQLRGLYHTVISSQNIPIAHGLLDELDFLGHSIDHSLETLTLSTFVVEKQPPQVMKTNTRLSSTVRFLAGTKLGVNLIRPTVKVIILSEVKARTIIKKHQEIINASWSSYLRSSPQLATGTLQSTDTSHQQTPANNVPINNQSQSNHAQISHQTPIRSPLIKTEQADQISGHMTSNSYHQRQQHQPHIQHLHHPHPLQQHQLPHQQQQQHNNLHHHHHHHQQQQQQHQQQQQQQLNLHQQQQPLQIAHPAQTVAQKVLNLSELDHSGEIVNNAQPLDYQDRQLISHFRSMQLKKIKRSDKKGTESVMDEKFILLFHTQIRIADSYTDDNSFSKVRPHSWINAHDLAFHIMAFSLPVVVIVHGNQEPGAWATITWHNAFARPDDILYRVPSQVTWRELSQVLSSKFETHFRKPLTKQNLNYLASKICRTRVDNDDVLVSWNQFAKEDLQGKQFTFWEWFHSIFKLTKENLAELWAADCIYGFTGKKNCIDLLLGSAQHEPAPGGTFLLRFSESALGGITFAWVSTSGNSPNNENIQILRQNSPTNSSGNILMHVKPFSSKDLMMRSLADRIKDLDDLVYLYPNIPKDEAFQDYYTRDNLPDNDWPDPMRDYVDAPLVQTIKTNQAKSVPPSQTSGPSPMDVSTVSVSPNSLSQSSPEGVVAGGGGGGAVNDNAFAHDADSTVYGYCSSNFGAAGFNRLA